MKAILFVVAVINFFQPWHRGVAPKEDRFAMPLHMNGSGKVKLGEPYKTG